MAQSVKLSNGNYIDTEGVYDATKGEAQSEINNRLGTVVQVSVPSDKSSWTSTVANEEYEVCSAELPVGKWLVIGAFGNTQVLTRLYIRKGNGNLVAQQSVGAWDSNKLTPGWQITLRAIALCEGNQTITLVAQARAANQAYTFSGNVQYAGILAICIG